MGDEPFAVLLADTVISGGSPLRRMLEVTRRTGTSCVALEECPPERVGRYGIAGGRAEDADIFRLDALEEKPALEHAPRLRQADGTMLPPRAFAARYVFTPDIFPALEECPPGRNGEIQLTDAMRTVMQRRGFYGVTLAGRRLDIGNPRGLIEAAAAMERGS